MSYSCLLNKQVSLASIALVINWAMPLGPCTLACTGYQRRMRLLTCIPLVVKARQYAYIWCMWVNLWLSIRILNCNLFSKWGTKCKYIHKISLQIIQTQLKRQGSPVGTKGGYSYSQTHSKCTNNGDFLASVEVYAGINVDDIFLKKSKMNIYVLNVSSVPDGGLFVLLAMGSLPTLSALQFPWTEDLSKCSDGLSCWSRDVTYITREDYSYLLLFNRCGRITIVIMGPLNIVSSWEQAKFLDLKEAFNARLAYHRGFTGFYRLRAIDHRLGMRRHCGGLIPSLQSGAILQK